MNQIDAGRSPRSSLSITLFTLLLFLLPHQGSAQAWTKPTGELYTKFSYGASTAADQYTFDGRRKEYADNVDDYAFFDRSLYLYGEYGLSDRFTVVAALPYKRIIVRDAAFRYRAYGLGNAELGLRTNLSDKVFAENSGNALAMNVGLSLPTGYYRNTAPSLGAGQVDATLNLSYGRSFHPVPAYAQGGLGFRYRSTIYGLSDALFCQEGVDKDCVVDAQPDFGDELTMSLEGGYTIGGLLLLQGLVNAIWSVAPPETGFTISNPLPTRQRYVKAGLGLYFKPIENLGLGVQSFTTPYGRNSVASIDLFFGVDYTFDFSDKEEESE